ncbi:MAG: N-acetylneuraminate synthase family protein [Desulfovibrio sp.]
MLTTIIAEMAWAHDGSLDKAVAIMRAAKNAGANAIGIHITDMPAYMVRYYGSGEGKVSAGHENLEVFAYLEKINLTHAAWLEFAAAARLEGIGLCVMPNDMPSLAFAEKELTPAAYALPAACFVDPEFLEAVAKTGKRTYFRIGGATLGEIEAAVDLFRQAGNGDIVLLHGIQSYPTDLADTHIAYLGTLKNLFGLPVGLADHIDGGSPLAVSLPLLALAHGATAIEKHLTFDRTEKGEDFESALDPMVFAGFVEAVRAAEIALGHGRHEALSPAQHRYRSVVRKKIVAARDLPAGTILAREHVAFKRCDVGLTLDKLDLILGRTLAVAVQADDTVEPSKLGACS